MSRTILRHDPPWRVSIPPRRPSPYANPSWPAPGHATCGGPEVVVDHRRQWRPRPMILPNLYRAPAEAHTSSRTQTIPRQRNTAAVGPSMPRMRNISARSGRLSLYRRRQSTTRAMASDGYWVRFSRPEVRSLDCLPQVRQRQRSRLYSEIRSSCLPTLRPSNNLRRVAGAFSSPCRMSTSSLRPSDSQPASAYAVLTKISRTREPATCHISILCCRSNPRCVPL